MRRGRFWVEVEPAGRLGTVDVRCDKTKLATPYIKWSDGTATWQLLRPGYYGHHRAAGWRVPSDDEDAGLDDEFQFEDNDSDDEDDDPDDSDGSGDSDHDVCDDDGDL